MKKTYGSTYRVFALSLAFSILFQAIAPTFTYAISSGPSQAEFSGFTSGDVSEMVDLSTGDFKYDIPLMTVPGADGGYPIVLSYNAGVGMHDEASWVGLGWSLNPGVINRQMRGVPDDFSGDNGDFIKKTNHIRDNMNIGLSVSSDLMAILPEVYGFDMGMVSNVSVPLSYTMYYNTFKGLGSRFGIGAGISALNNEFNSANATASINLTLDSNDGGEVQGNLSAGTGFMEANTGFVYTARGGVTSVSKGLTFNMPMIPKAIYKAGGNYSTASHVPDVAVEMAGGSAALTVDIEAGAFGNHLNIPIRLEGSFSYMGVLKNKVEYNPYGYLYNHRRKFSDTEYALMDYNKDNDVPINMKLPSLPVPVSTHDIYIIKGVGGGSVFRAFRNDASIYYQPDAYTRSAGATVGLEVAAAAGFKAAADISGFYSSSYSGKWRGDFALLDSKFKMQGNDPLELGKPSRNEAFYFKKLGEQTPMMNKGLYESYGGTSPSHIGITYSNASQEDIDPSSMPDYEGEYPFSGMQKFKTRIANQMNGNPIPLFAKNERERKNSLVEYRTAGEIRNGGTEFFMAPNVYGTLINSSNYTQSLNTFDFGTAAHIQNNHIGEFSVLQADGSRFYYGIPAYNMSQKEAVFSSTPTSYAGPGNDLSSGPLGAYNPDMLLPNKNNSRDKYIKIDEISPYAHSYLLTNILSSDYVDLTNDGPSEDDYGSFTKFNYTKLSDSFRWRVPFTEEEGVGINAKGFLSVAYDNHTTFTTGTKQLWYLQSVETKTHIAFFVLSPRNDGYQAKSENGGRAAANQQKLMRLDKIILFSKEELKKTYPVALKTVSFEYSYDLCPGTPTNDASVPAGYDHPLSPGNDANLSGGKLTLHKITITHESSSKGSLTPYIFEYGTTPEENPAYDYADTDRWGTYRPDDELSYGYRNDYNPYVIQDPTHKGILDKQAGAWNLKKINTPSGSTVQIEYECDDYAYIQDKPAQQMMKIIGMGKVDGSKDVFEDESPRLPIRKEFRRIYFQPEVPLSGSSTVIDERIGRYVEGLPDGRLYFKVNERLQIPKDIEVSPLHVSDYVTGYTTVESYGHITREGGEVIPYIVIPEISHASKNPLRAAGLQYLRYKRADLSMTSPGGMQNVTEAVMGSIPMFFSALELIFGYYNWAIMKGHCEFIHTEKPSFIRLCSPDGIKYGGGHRVKKITVNDGWSELGGTPGSSGSYEQNFVYTTTDGRAGTVSSGVAAYEPIHGGDENALKYPYLYDPDNKYIHNDKAFFMEDPLPETYYPAPQVAYSRVTTYSTATETVKKSGSGISVNEFYTAKDYPTISRQSQPTKTDDDQTTFIPFVAGIQFRNLGYSQAFSVEVNDMHGKIKSHYTYDSDNWNASTKDLVDDSRFLTYKKYVYNRVSPEGLSSPVQEAWSEKYPTLADDSPTTGEGALGLDFELFAELKESSDFSFSGGAQINGGVDPAPYAIFISAMPYFEYTETGARTVTTNKIIYRTAVLSEVINYNEGNIERTRHVSYDSETGVPLLSITTSDYDDQTTDEYEKPTYSYEMPAHWYYEGMEGAYKNYRVEADLTVVGSVASCSTSVNAGEYFYPGDELYCSTCPAGSKKLWVSSVSGTDVNLVKKDNTLPSLTGSHHFTVLRSGKRNQPMAISGKIVSTRPPNGPGVSPLLDSYNAAAEASSTVWTSLVPFSFVDCMDGEVVHNGSIVTIDLGSTTANRIAFRFASCRGSIFIELNQSVDPSDLRLYPGPSTNTVYVTNVNTGITVLEEMRFDNVEECALRCMDGILDASTIEYRNEHEFDAADLASPSLNEYASGKKGLFRVCRSNAYFATRKQSSGATTYPMYQTFTGEDGTYDKFVKFDFDLGNDANVQKPYGWRWASQIPERGISRDGRVLQTQNPLGLLSGNLYGYDRNLITATAVNASHREIGFESFEEHPLGTYSTTNNNGRLVFTTPYGTITDEKAHTGKRSIKTAYNSPFYSLNMLVPIVSSIDYNSSSKQIQLLPNKKYVLSFWVSHTGIQAEPSVGLLIGSTAYGLNMNQPALDGWRRFEAVFETPSSGNLLIVLLGNPAYVDDIRIHPFNSEMKTIVYDPVKYIPVAELDTRNYATFNVYDEEGALTIIKKETEKGIQTVGHTRTNLNR